MDIFAAPVTDILNSSLRQAKLPLSWKKANIVPIPKHKPVVFNVVDVNKDLRPSSLTPVLHKVAEGYLIEQFVKPTVLTKVDPQQFETIPRSNTTLAFVSMVHSWLTATDGSGATTRTVLLHFKKAFDLIHHRLLVEKIRTYDIVDWIMDFLNGRGQRV